MEGFRDNDYTYTRISNTRNNIQNLDRLWRAGMMLLDENGNFPVELDDEQTMLFFSTRFLLREICRTLVILVNETGIPPSNAVVNRPLHPQNVNGEPFNESVFRDFPTVHFWLRNFRFARPAANPIRNVDNRWVGFMEGDEPVDFWNVIITPENRELQNFFDNVVNPSPMINLRNGPIYMFFAHTDRGVIVRFVAVYVPRMNTNPEDAFGQENQDNSRMIEIYVLYDIPNRTDAWTWLTTIQPVVPRGYTPSRQ